MITRRTTKQEQGTVAIIVAVSAVMIFGLSAMAVDLGSAFARKRDIQTQADLATLAAAAKLPHSASREAAIRQAAMDYLGGNEVAGQVSAGWNFSDDDAGTPASRANGYIEFVTANKLRLIAPQSHVDFWLAPAAGLADGMEVSAVAAAEILSPGKGLPMFISTSCGWKAQTLLDPSPGHDTTVPGYVPNLGPPTSTPPSSIDLTGVTPPSLPQTPTPVTVTITAAGNKSMQNVTAVTWGTEPSAPGGQRSYPSPGPVTVLPGSGGAQKTQVTATIPAEVHLSNDTEWWVRVFDNGKWSAPADAWRFTVGAPVTSSSSTCEGSTSGNFGSLKLSRSSGSPADFLEENLAQGIEHDLVAFQKPASGSYPNPCQGTSGAVMDGGSPVASVNPNCLKTDTGLFQAAATRAFISGTKDGTPGRLNVDTMSMPGVGGAGGCGPGRSAARRPVTISGGPTRNWAINNDVLSCFFTDDSVTVGAVSGQFGAPAHVIDAKIFESPRFFWIPVLVDDPSRGTSGSYAIVDFRPVFVTKQADSATRQTPGSDPDNGVEMDSNGIAKLRIRAINPVSLPEYSADLGPDGTIPYIGSGTKIVRLIE